MTRVQKLHELRKNVRKSQQYHILILAIELKEIYFVYSILNELAGKTFVIFCSACESTVRMALILRALGMTAVPLHDQMTPKKRLAALDKFKANDSSIIILSDHLMYFSIKSIDIPTSDVVINLNIPTKMYEYVHPVRHSKKAITFVTLNCSNGIY